MPLPVQTTPDDLEETAPLVVDASPPEIDANAETIATDHEATDPVVAIELNFNAFADNCPPTKHAKRVANHLDPSIQDFADQALELATLRAELKRLTREYESLERTAKQRDQTIQMLRDKLSELRAHSHEVTHTPLRAEPVAAPTPAPAPPVCAPPAEPKVESATADEPAASNATPTVKLHSLSIDSPPESSSSAPQTSPTKATSNLALVPVDHEDDCIYLVGDIITIGRTKRSDICIPTHAVSRDHARLLVNRGKVTIFDMDSANGCLVNGEPVKRQRLNEGDVVRIGDRSYRFTSNASAAAASTGPSA